MSALTITDLPACHRLDLKAMSAFRGGSAPWVYGWIRPFTGDNQDSGPVINFIQINNSFTADQMNNQFQVVNVSNSAPDANLNVVVGATAANTKHA